MSYNWFTQNPLKVFTDESVSRIHTNVMTLLHDVGMNIDSREALNLLAEYGVRCDFEKLRAYPDEGNIQRALQTVQKSYKLFGRRPDEEQVLSMNFNTVYTVPGGAAIKIYSGGEYVEATRDDLVNMTVLHEKLDNVDILIGTVEPREMMGKNMYPEIAANLFSYSSKPLILPVSSRRDLEKIIRMASLLAGGEDELKKKPVFITGANSEPPLRITRDGAEVLMCAARRGIPVSLGSYLMMGTTGPFNVAASIVQRTAEVLSGLLLTQAAQPGSAYDFTCHVGCTDFATGDAITMSPQVMQLVTGSIQMGRHYGLRVHSLASTESKTPDAQASGERFFALTLSAMAGASIISHTTSCMAGMELADFAQCVIDNEIIGYVLEFAKGISMDGFEEAMSVIKDVAQDPQYSDLYFLGHPHTAKYCRDGYKPDLFSIGMLSRHIAEKRGSILGKAETRAQELLKEKKEFVSPDIKQELLKIALED